MNDLWASLTALIQDAPALAGVFLAVLSIMHPLVGGPLSILIQTLWIALVDHVLLASLLMWGLNLIGIFLYFELFNRFIHRIDPWLSRQKKITALLAWGEKKAPWQHVIALGLPFIYTYPLRITLIKNQTRLRFTWMLGLSYLMLNLFNLLLIYTVFGSLTAALPPVVPILVFLGILLVVYAFKSKLDLE